MRVVLVGAGMIEIPPPGYGAVEKHVWNLAQALEKRGHEVRIVNRVFGPRSKDEYRFAFWARKEILRAGYDALHLHTPGVATILNARGPRRWVYTTHSRHWSGVSGVGPRIGHFLEKRAVASAAEAIAVSKLVADQIDRPVHVIPNGVDVARYAPDPAARSGRRFVGVGEVAPHKCWHLAAEATRDLGVELRLIGPIRDVPYARNVEAAGPHVKLMGALDEGDLISELGAADALVHPSVSESFGMAVVEGMSAGLPVICSDMLSFLVTHEKEGLLVPTKGTDEDRSKVIRERAERLLADPAARARMGEAARAKAVASYSWERVAEQVEGVYRRLVA